MNTRILFLAMLMGSALPLCTRGQLSTASSIEKLEKDIPVLMAKADVPGLSAALIRDGKLVWRKHFGVADAETKQPVGDNTIFEAASLSKIVTAYGALKLVDQGKLDLDKPLNSYLGNNYDAGNDDRINKITMRHVLSHSAGFPNWRPQESAILPINFNPGEKFSYSGEGFVYLSKVMEKITGLTFNDYITQAVFIPLKMTQSSFEWKADFKERQVYRHDWLGNKSFRWEGPGSNAAASLRTTAEDYAKFVIAVLNGQGLKKATWQEMLKPQITVNEKAPALAWGLGLGLQTTPSGTDFWHWGDQGDSKCYVDANLAHKNAFVYFTNSANGLSVAYELLDDALAGNHPALDWLNYGRYNPDAKNFYHSVISRGADSTLAEFRAQKASGSQTLNEGQINRIGYQLMRAKKLDEAIAVFEQNTRDYPASSNVWDSLAEGHMTKGNKAEAIKYYEKAIEVDPGNTNSIGQLKKLRGQ